MTARTKEEVIEELTDLLIQDGAVTNKEDFIRDVWLREELGSTGFETISLFHMVNLPVFPVPYRPSDARNMPFPWETMDGSDVRCVILFAVCLVDQNATHIRLLAQVSGSLADEDIIAKLLVESDPHKIIALFNSETENAGCLIPTCYYRFVIY